MQDSVIMENLSAGPLEVIDDRNGHKLCDRGQLTIRLARVDEASEIVTFTNTLFDGTPHFSRAAFNNASDVEQLMKEGKFLLAEKDEAIVGFAYLKPRLEASRIDLIAVSPRHRQTGIGSQLLYAAERLSSSMRCLFMHIHVMNLHWETIKFCRRRGYIEFGIESLNRHQPVSPHCHIVRMCKQLDTERLAF